jgi:two-component system, OmpR family, sensor histidine kinase SenX3
MDVGSDLPVTIAAGVAVVLLVGGLWLRARRSLVRRILKVAARLDDQPLGMEGLGGKEAALERLEGSAEQAHLRVDEANGASLRLSASLNHMPDGIVVVDQRGDLVLRNSVAEQFTGPGGDALTADAIWELLDRALRGLEGERELRLFGPPRRVLHVRAVPLDDGSRPIGAAAFLRDVSETRRIENMRRDFVANVSHELKTPIGALGLLAETMAGEEDAEMLRRLAGRVLHESERLERTVEDLLDLSILEAQESPERELIAVDRLMADAAERMASTAEAAGTPIELTEPSGDILVACDRRQVTSALFNLLDNAVKYSEEGGKVEFSAQVEGFVVAISVRDHGIGIPSRDMERIFERFYRVDRTRSRATGGTGLGLAIVRHVAQAHQGEVSVESEEGQGSTFTLKLPLAAASRSVRRTRHGRKSGMTEGRSATDA